MKQKDKKKDPHKRQRTQWATQFLAAAELVRRGYTVSLTMGNNTPIADLMVGTPVGKQFWVDVKGLSGKNYWLVTPKPDHLALYYVLVFLAPLVDYPNKRLPDRFFILTQSEANKLVSDYAKAHPNDKGKRPGFHFDDPKESEDAWHKLPDLK